MDLHCWGGCLGSMRNGNFAVIWQNLMWYIYKYDIQSQILLLLKKSRFSLCIANLNMIATLYIRENSRLTRLVLLLETAPLFLNQFLVFFICRLESPRWYTVLLLLVYTFIEKRKWIRQARNEELWCTLNYRTWFLIDVNPYFNNAAVASLNTCAYFNTQDMLGAVIVEIAVSMCAVNAAHNIYCAKLV